MVMNDELLLVQLLDETAASSNTKTSALLTIADKIRKSESFVMKIPFHFIIYRLTQMCVIKTHAVLT